MQSEVQWQLITPIRSTAFRIASGGKLQTSDGVGADPTFGATNGRLGLPLQRNGKVTAKHGQAHQT